jgi:hypothetical protein
MAPIFVVLQVTVLWPLMCLKGEENRIEKRLQCIPFPNEYHRPYAQRTSAEVPFKAVGFAHRRQPPYVT